MTMKKLLYSGLLALVLGAFAQEADAQTTVTRSRARQNTAVGAAAGAATGAIVSRKKGKGAIIGGVVGAAGGYAWGKHQDRKKGRKVKVKH